MKIGFFAFDNMTLLDLIGVYDPLVRIKTMGFNADMQYDIISNESTIFDFGGVFSFSPGKVVDSLSEYDLIVVPGGYGTRKLINDKEIISLLKTVSSNAVIASVCSGALLLGAAGLLDGKTATTHRNVFKELESYNVKVVDRRIVKDGNIITARGVSSSLDLGLYLCKKYFGYKIMNEIAVQMDYSFDKSILGEDILL